MQRWRIPYQAKQIGFIGSRLLFTRRHELEKDVWYLMHLHFVFIVCMCVCDCDVTLLWCQSPMLEVVAPPPRANKKVLSLRIFKVLLRYYFCCYVNCKLQIKCISACLSYGCVDNFSIRRSYSREKRGLLAYSSKLLLLPCGEGFSFPKWGLKISDVKEMLKWALFSTKRLPNTEFVGRHKAHFV